MARSSGGGPLARGPFPLHNAGMAKRLFTPREANRTLPLVRRIVRDILEIGRELRGYAESADREGSARAKEALARCFAELEQIGCSYKDWSFEIGLVDFPAVLDGEPVFLCWRSDEPDVRWFHPRNAGYAARRPIPARLLAAADEDEPTSEEAPVG